MLQLGSVMSTQKNKSNKKQIRRWVVFLRFNDAIFFLFLFFYFINEKKILYKFVLLVDNSIIFMAFFHLFSCQFRWRKKKREFLLLSFCKNLIVLYSAINLIFDLFWSKRGAYGIWWVMKCVVLCTKASLMLS